MVALPAVAARAWRALAEPGGWRLVWRLVPAVLVVAAGAFGPGPLTVAGSLIAAAALINRFAAPITSLLIGTLLAVVATFGPGMTLLVLPWPVIVILSYTAGRRSPQTRRVVAALCFSAMSQSGAHLAVSLAQPGQDTVNAALGALVVLLAIGLPGVAGMAGGERDRRFEALRERNILLERANRLGEAQARIQERARIAGEMHDLIGHRLSLIVLHAGALELRTRGSAAEINSQAEILCTTSRAALQELRTVLGILRLDGDDNRDGTNAEVGTTADLSALVEESRSAGLPVELSWTGDDLADADPGVRRALHRILREALTNVHKHAAGAATTVAVSVDQVRVRIEIRNARRRSPGLLPGGGMGLNGLRERVRLLGGDFRVWTEPDGSHVVSASLPIDQTDVADRQFSSGVQPAETVPSSPREQRSTRLMSKAAKIVLSVVGAVVVLCGGVGIGVYHLVRQAVSPQTYQQIATGDTQDRVRELTGGDSVLAREAIRSGQPGTPAGATCDYVHAEGFETVYRFCFADGKLVQKDEITLS